MLDTEKLWQILGGAVAFIISLVGVLYHRQEKTNQDIQQQLDEGQDEFTRGKVQFKALEKDVDNLGKEFGELAQDVTDLEVKQLQDHEKLLAVEIHCQHNHEVRQT